jgi:hypothetical protein
MKDVVSGFLRTLSKNETRGLKKVVIDLSLLEKFHNTYKIEYD